MTMPSTGIATKAPNAIKPPFEIAKAAIKLKKNKIRADLMFL